MPTLKTPLYGSTNNRSFATPAAGGKDQFVRGALITKVVNPLTNTATYYTEKRPGFLLAYTPGFVSAKAVFYSNGTTHVISLGTTSGASGLKIYDSTGASTNVDCGTLLPTSNTFLNSVFSEMQSGSVTYILLGLQDGNQAWTGWFLPSDAISTTAYTADGNNSTTITDIKVSGVNSVAGLYVGQKLSAATNIATDSRIVSINAGAFSAVLDTATTGGAFNDLAITKEPVAKIIDADFPSDMTGGLFELDGYVSVMTTGGKVYSSDLNNPASWTATNFLTCSKYADKGLGVVRYKNMYAAFGAASIEFLYNAANPSGSPFSSSDNAVFGKEMMPSSPGAITAINDTVYWIGNDRNIYCLKGFSASRVNNDKTPLISVPVKVNSFSLNGKAYLSYLASPYSQWYCVDDNTVVAPHTSETYYRASYGGLYAWFTNNDDNIYRILEGATSTYTDNGSAFTMSVQIGTDMGTDTAKAVNALRVLADNQSSGTLNVYYSDNDGTSYKGPFAIDLSKKMKQITRLGTFDGERLWKFEDSGNNADRIKMIEIDYTVLA